MLSWTTLTDFFGSTALAIASVALGAALAALLVQMILTAIVSRLTTRHPYMHALVKRSTGPLRLLLPMLAVQTVLSAAPDFDGRAGWQHMVLLLTILSVTWLGVAAVLCARDAIKIRFPLTAGDNFHTRRLLTQSTVLLRTLSGLIILFGLAGALMTFPGVRQIGASLLASAGLAGIVVGFAARPVLGNLIAGLQIAMAQPIRIDDVLIVQGEWGRVEEITGAYVVLKIWDERRLVVPLQWFIENSFQNWTRTGSSIIGTVFIWVDYTLPLEPLRAEMMRICEASKEWDRRVAVLQVTDASDRAMQLRVLVSSADSSRNWDLRCRMREGLIAFIQREHPTALPMLRAEMITPVAAHKESSAVEGSTDSRATALGRATPDPPK